MYLHKKITINLSLAGSIHLHYCTKSKTPLTTAVGDVTNPKATFSTSGGTVRLSTLSGGNFSSKISSITAESLAFSPATFLLHMNPRTLKSYRKLLTMFLINAARLCIPRLWGSTKTLSLLDWYKQVDKLAEMEELVSISHDTPNAYAKTWDAWFTFRNTNKKPPSTTYQTYRGIKNHKYL